MLPDDAAMRSASLREALGRDRMERRGSEEDAWDRISAEEKEADEWEER
jgi:hypothetical protein